MSPTAVNLSDLQGHLLPETFLISVLWECSTINYNVFSQWPAILTVLLKLRDFSASQVVVTYIA